MTASEDASARRMGWRSEAEWDDKRAAAEGRRRPARFLTARQYLDKVDTDLPVLRERNRYLDEQLAAAEATIAELNELVGDLHEANKRIVRLLQQETIEAEAKEDDDGSDAWHTRTYADLTDQEKERCDKFCRNVPGCSPEDYLALYG